MTSVWLTERFGGIDPSNYTWADIHGTNFLNPFGGRPRGRLGADQRW